MGTCDQRDTGQGHPDKGTGHRSDDYLQTHVRFAGMALKKYSFCPTIILEG